MRPRVWDELLGLNESPINPNISQKDILIDLAKTGRVSILMFVGPSGTGKTSAGRLFAATYLGVDYDQISLAAKGVGRGTPYYMEKNASGERGIDVIRALATDYICLTTDNDKCRVLLFDEADGLTYQAQEALKAVTQQYSHNCIFIFCLNKFSRMDDALISRSGLFYFDPIPKKDTTKWLSQQCKNWDITVSSNTLAKVLDYYKGDLRRITNDFLNVYKGNEVTRWRPRKTYAKKIFDAADPVEKYLELAGKEYLDPQALIKELLVVNKHQNPAIFGQATIMLMNGGDPMIAVEYALTGLKK